MNDKLKEVIFGGGSAVFLGGAGVSTASGIPDFRSSEQTPYGQIPNA